MRPLFSRHLTARSARPFGARSGHHPIISLSFVTMSHQMELEFAKVCYADKRTWNGVVFNLGEFALTACQLRSR